MKPLLSSLALSSLTGSRTLDPELERLVEAAVARLQVGEPLDLERLAEEHPERADELRQLLAMITSLVELRDDAADRTETATTSGEPVPLPHKELGDFRLIRELGHGGMGTVFEAEQLSMGRRVALKVLPFAALANDKSLQRFRNEVRAAAALDHPNIVSVYSVGEERGVHYFAMQLIRGQTLAELIEDLQASRPNSSQPGSARASDETIRYEQSRVRTVADSRQAAERYRSVARLGIQAAEALQHAHDQGVLHRDIKPSNLMLDAEGQLYVTDFGLARIEADAGLTMTGDIIGTLRYMAPEQALAKRVVIDHRADIYSLGATLYELLTLQPAFCEIDRSELLKQLAFEEPKPLRKLDRRIPAELETIVLKAMAKSPDERYQTAQLLDADLNAFLEHRPITAKPPKLIDRAAKWSRRHIAVVWSAAAVLVTCAIALAASNFRIRQESALKELALAEKIVALDTARKAVDQMLIRIADEKLKDTPNLEPIRVAIFEDALEFYEQLGKQRYRDITLQNARATTLIMVSGIQRELGRFDEARRLGELSIRLQKDLVAEYPGNPELQFLLAMFEQHHAYTWSVVPPGPNSMQVNKHYQNALTIYRDLEHENPAHPQPMAMCLRYFAKDALQHGHRGEAIRLWRDAIEQNEQYVRYSLKHPFVQETVTFESHANDGYSSHPRNVENARIEICWACFELAGALLNRAHERVEVLQMGVNYSSTLHTERPDSIQIRDLHSKLMLAVRKANEDSASNKDPSVVIDHPGSLDESSRPATHATD